MYFGEISLSGDVRPAPQPELRLKEAAKLGFSVAVVPKGLKVERFGLQLIEVKDVSEIAGPAVRTRGQGSRAKIES